MSSYLRILLCLIATCFVTVHAGGFKILGGYVDEYDKHSSNYYGKSFQWGKTEADENSEELAIEQMYCYTQNWDSDGYCYHYLIASTKDDPTEEHYQIIGSYQKIYKNGDIILETMYANGVTEEEPPYQKQHVASCQTWCEETNSFRYGDLYFFLNKTTQPSITDDISYLAMNAKNNDQHKDEVFLGYHEDTSVRVEINGVKSWSDAWEEHTYLNTYFWRAPTTLVDAEPLNDQANFISLNYNGKQTVELMNEGSGVTSPDLPILGTTTTFSTSSESRFETSWDYDYSFEEAITFEIFSVSSEFTMSEDFTYHTEEEMTEKNTVTTTLDITWPNECPAGFKITYSVIETTEQQEVPVNLIFKRAGVEWTEVDQMSVTLRKLDLVKDDCCLYDWADESCGTDELEMCDTDDQ